MATWVADFRRVQAQREYAMWRREDGRLVARASARWGYVDRGRGQPMRLQDELAGSIPVLGGRMPVRRLSLLPVEGDPPAIQGELALTAREVETDSQQHINNCVYGDWLAEGLHWALQEDAEASGARPRYYRIEYVRPALAGEELRVVTSAYPRGSRGLGVRQEIVGARDGSICVRAASEHLRQCEPTATRPAGAP